MKLGWEVKNLIDVCEKMFAGGDVPKDNFSKIETAKYKIPIFANGIKDKGLYGFTDIEKVINPSITISARGTIGYSEIRNEPFFPIVRLIVLIPNTKIITLEFLQYIIKSIDFKKSGTSIPQLTIPNVKKYQLNIPLIDEQEQIVKILDKAFKTIEKVKVNIEQNIENTKELFQSKLNEIFSQKGDGWEDKGLGEICEVIAGQSPESKFYNKDKNGLAFYQGKKEFKEKYIGNPTTWTTKITKEALKDDILMSVRAPVGPVNFSTQNICIGRGLAAIRASDKIEIEYLFYFLKYYESQIVGNNGAVFNSINKKQIENLKVPLPNCTKEQELIVKQVDKLSKQTKQLENKYQQKLNNLEELKKSILQKAFNGELTS